MCSKWILILSAVALISCEKETLKPEQVYKTRDLEIKFIAFTDSRCPTGTNCVWEGTASVELEAVSENQTVLFTLDGIGADTVLFDHRIKFVDLLPYPGEGVTIDPEDKELVLDVVKL